MIQYIIYIIGISVFIAFLYASIQSFIEKERRAGSLFLLFCLAFTILFFFLYKSDEDLYRIIFLLVFALIGILLFIPIRIKVRQPDLLKLKRVDERTTIFARNALKSGESRYTDFYELYPEFKQSDDKFRENPGLLSKNAAFYHNATFEASNANFSVVSLFRQITEKEPYSVPGDNINPKKLSRFIKTWAIKLGACDAGICELKPYHIYTHIGRWENYGKEVSLRHPFAIAFLVDMEKEMFDPAPKGSSIFESSEKYLKTGQIAVQIAEFLRSLGYQARAHIDADYRLICPLVARDAGLGDIGRMGLLMSHKHGPRVRIAVVTSNAPLIPAKAKQNDAMIDFCTHCKKCSTNCPSNAIPFDKRATIGGVYRWKIDADACFSFWTKSGTDCGKCIRVCPFAHPNNPMHNLVRRAISNNLLFSRLALKLDDLFYGKHPKQKKLPEWMNIID